jgi:hypothetical protein
MGAFAQHTACYVFGFYHEGGGASNKWCNVKNPVVYPMITLYIDPFLYHLYDNNDIIYQNNEWITFSIPGEKNE